jgi:thymidylate synthase
MADLQQSVGDIFLVCSVRHFGAPYVDMHADYTGQGVDQLRECIHKIKTNPSDR